ncbi:MAG: dihydroorotate dehydrogenase electron transfer subunit [Nitrospirae bacterium]|nr:MAG: dihydroorotate dehydrogenase electron transfer subunit [Nitrospirota bacterium]
MSRHLSAEVDEVRFISEDHFILTLIPADAINHPLPGQFFLLRKDSCGDDPLLRRPFSVLDYNNGKLRFFIRITGRGTAAISRSAKGDKIDILGPLGNPFPPPSEGERAVIVAGGVGIASVFPLLKRESQKGVLLYGARTARAVYLLTEIEETGIDVRVSTDDGSMGYKGGVLDLFRDYLDEGGDGVVYSCGPELMIQGLAGIMKDRGINGYLSLEERMACGIGACLGCVKEVGGRKRRVCVEGPVFNISEF